ncbi:MAG: hypothetical protein RSA27_04475, partial [Oscillospiraceae bacterium]
DKDNLLAILKNVPYMNIMSDDNNIIEDTQIVELPSLRTNKIAVHVVHVEFIDGTHWNINGSSSELPKDIPYDTVIVKSLNDSCLDYSLQNKSSHDIMLNVDAENHLNELNSQIQEYRKKTIIKILTTFLIFLIIGGIAFLTYNYIKGGADEYSKAMELYDAGEYKESLTAMSNLTNHRLNDKKEHELRWCMAMANVEIGEYGKAIKPLWDNGDYKDGLYNLREIVNAYSGVIAAGSKHSVGLKKDGRVVAVGDNQFGQCDVADWAGVVAVDTGADYTVAVTIDGELLATGYNKFGQCDLPTFKDFKAVSAGQNHTAMLRKSGKVMAMGDNKFGQCDVSEWSGIVSISTGGNHTVGRKSDGTIVATGQNDFGQCEVNGLTNVVAVSAGDSNTVAIMADGTIKVIGNKDFGQTNTNSTTDIIAASFGGRHMLGLKNSGKVISLGNNDKMQGGVSGWVNSVAVSAGENHSLSVTRDGSVFAAGENDKGQCNIEEWRDIGIPTNSLQMVAY